MNLILEISYPPFIVNNINSACIRDIIPHIYSGAEITGPAEVCKMPVLHDVYGFPTAGLQPFP